VIAVFGGSFNPVTLAHKKIIDRIKKLDEVTKVIIVPVSDKYEKKGLSTNVNHRIEMLKLVIEKDIIISDFEARQDHQLKSLETLTHFKEEYNDDLALVIGSDNLEDFKNWYEPEKLMENFYLIVINRQSDLGKIILSNPTLTKYKEKIIEINDLDLNISSTKAKRELNNQYLDQRVIDYILLNDLYTE